MMNISLLVLSLLSSLLVFPNVAKAEEKEPNFHFTFTCETDKIDICGYASWRYSDEIGCGSSQPTTCIQKGKIVTCVVTTTSCQDNPPKEVCPKGMKSIPTPDYPAPKNGPLPTPSPSPI